MTTITVYDPPMCCSTGVCGPRVDPVLPRFAADLDWLKQQGVTVQRYNPAQEPGSFASNPVVVAALAADPSDSLPLILAGDTIVSRGTYPTREQLAAWAGVTVNDKAATPAPKPCCGSSGCC